MLKLRYIVTKTCLASPAVQIVTRNVLPRECASVVQKRVWGEDKGVTVTSFSLSTVLTQHWSLDCNTLLLDCNRHSAIPRSNDPFPYHLSRRGWLATSTACGPWFGELFSLASGPVGGEGGKWTVDHVQQLFLMTLRLVGIQMNQGLRFGSNKF